MNQTIETILKRRSTRVFSSEQINSEYLESILKAGLYAPSTINNQSWHFTVIQNKEILNKLNTATKNVAKQVNDDMIKQVANNENYNIFYNAPTVILVPGEKSAIDSELNCAAATQNILLASESIGIGSCWVGFISFLFKSKKEIPEKNKLKIPEGFTPYYAISLGYKKVKPGKAHDRRENTVTFIE